MFCTSMNQIIMNLSIKLTYTFSFSDKDFQKGWLTDNTNINISSKNKNYV